MHRLTLASILVLAAGFAVADDLAKTITVSGTGSAAAAPDRASVQMSIVVRDKSLDAAQESVAKTSEKILAITDALDIERKRVDTTGASVRADYRYNRETEEQEFRGYIAERRIAIEIRDLDKLAPVVEGAVAAGVNQVSPPNLYSSRRGAAYRDALDNAAQDARANAEQLARSLGVKLGDALSVSTAGVAQPPSPMLRSGMAMAADSGRAESYNAGDQEITATVSVVFAIR